MAVIIIIIIIIIIIVIIPTGFSVGFMVLAGGSRDGFSRGDPGNG